jgi:hypothetical protein
LIIARYDEVLCDKAPKHSLLEMRSEMESKFVDLDKLVAKAEEYYKGA